MEEEDEENEENKDNNESDNEKGNENDTNNENNSSSNNANENNEKSSDLFSDFLGGSSTAAITATTTTETKPKISTTPTKRSSSSSSASSTAQNITPNRSLSLLESKWDNSFRYKGFTYFVNPKLLFGPNMKDILPSPVKCVGRVGFPLLQNHIESSVNKGKGVSLYSIEPQANVRDKLYQLSEQLCGKERAAIAECDYKDHKLTVYIVPKLKEKQLNEIPIIYRRGEKDAIHLILIHNETERNKENINLITEKVEDVYLLYIILYYIVLYLEQRIIYVD